VHGANRLASNSLLESLVFAWRAVDALDETTSGADFDTAAARPTQSATIAGAERSGSERVETPTRADIQNLMWAAVGLERDATTLRTALDTLAGWIVEGSSVPSLEERNLLDLARLMARAALVREESRGAHDRTDVPETREQWRHSLVWTLQPAAIAQEVPA
jgi:L-aspartate oxidase